MTEAVSIARGFASEPAPGAARVTVVVPCYNQSHYLGECLESIRRQTEQDFEVIVVDDASPDRAEIRRVVEELGDPRIRVVRHERNKGLGGSRNTGIRESRSQLVLPLDADDRLAPDCLERLAAELEEDSELDCAYPDVQLFGRLDRVITFAGPSRGQSVLREKDTIPGAGTMMRRGLWERLGGYDEADELRRGREDFEFYLRAFSEGARAKRVGRPLYEYRIAHASMNFACRLEDHVVARYIYEKHRELFDRAGESRRFLCAWYQKASIASWESGRRARAFRLALRAFRYGPTRGRLRLVARSLVPFDREVDFQRGELRRRIPFLGYKLHGEARFRPFFVIGVGRSGNTLLRRILTSHSRLHIPPETFVLGRIVELWRRHGRQLAWPDLVALVLAQLEFHPEFHTFRTSLQPLHERLSRLPRGERNLARVLDAFYRHHAEAIGASCERWGDKTPMNSLDDDLVRGREPRRLGQGVPRTLERLLSVFPDAQFLHLYRDGVDVVASHLRGGFFADVESAGKRWLHVERQTRNFARAHPERSWDVRYEELVARPQETVRGICAFLGVDFEPAMLASEKSAETLGDVPAWSWHANVARPIDASNAGRGRRLLGPEDRRLLQRLIGSELAELGYPPADAVDQAAGGPPEEVRA